jgi:hypothetical protein
MVIGIFYGGLFLALAAMSFLAFQVWRGREVARQQARVTRRIPPNRKDQPGA